MMQATPGDDEIKKNTPWVLFKIVVLLYNTANKYIGKMRT